ncbi:MAG: hypothetical protein AAFW69_05290 [Pseudomonadota bacterium]
MRRVKSLTALVITFGLMAAPASAQLLNRLNDLGFGNEDYRLLTDAAETLYDIEDPQVGSETIWSNPQTNAHGTVELIAWDGECATVHHVFSASRTNEIYRADVKRCKSADGRWQLVAE